MLFFLFLFYSINILHPIHVSVTDVDITSNEITWTSRIYKDDLLLGMYGKEVNIALLDDREKIEKNIHKYLTNNIGIQLNGTNLKWILKEVNADQEAIWITVSSAATTTPSSQLIIQNRILLDVYNDQKNVVNFNWPSGKKNFVFEKGREKETLKI